MNYKEFILLFIYNKEIILFILAIIVSIYEIYKNKVNYKMEKYSKVIYNITNISLVLVILIASLLIFNYFKGFVNIYRNGLDSKIVYYIKYDSNYRGNDYGLFKICKDTKCEDIENIDEYDLRLLNPPNKKYEGSVLKINYDPIVDKLYFFEIYK